VEFKEVETMTIKQTKRAKKQGQVEERSGGRLVGSFLPWVTESSGSLFTFCWFMSVDTIERKLKWRRQSTKAHTSQLTLLPNLNTSYIGYALWAIPFLLLSIARSKQGLSSSY
jgi:hypothetical protein